MGFKVRPVNSGAKTGRGRSYARSVARMPDNPVELHELFDADNKIDRWMFMLAAVMADLAPMESTFKNAVHGDDSHPAHRFYLQRQLAARIFEANRVVLAIRGNREIEKFVQRVGAKEKADWLIARYAKGDSDESVIDEILREGRHRTVHHARLNSDELRATLAVAHDEAMIIERHEGKGRSIIEFPETVLTRYIFAGEDGDFDERLMRKAIDLMEEVLRHFAALWSIVWPEQVRRKGIDPARLHRIVGGDEDGDE